MFGEKNERKYKNPKLCTVQVFVKFLPHSSSFKHSIRDRQVAKPTKSIIVAEISKMPKL